jgi:hypothetical protein
MNLKFILQASIVEYILEINIISTTAAIWIRLHLKHFPFDQRVVNTAMLRGLRDSLSDDRGEHVLQMC